MKKIVKNIPYILSILLVLFIRQANLLGINIVSGSSMSPTLKNGQIILGSSLYKELQRGDIVVVNKGDKLVIKRIVGLPGEEISGKNGKVYINDKIVKEDYVKEENNTNTSEWSYQIGDNEYFVIGDNRDNSYDCRFYGPINQKMIVQKIWTN